VSRRRYGGQRRAEGIEKPVAVKRILPTEVVTTGLEAGADDVLVRPINIEVLTAKLRRALAQRQLPLQPTRGNAMKP
jgi:CheY-like chemotaxis protein